MRSTLGRRASICKEFGWTVDYVEHGIGWSKLQMMIMDMPRLEKSDGKTTVELTDDNAEEVLRMIMAKTN